MTLKFSCVGQSLMRLDTEIIAANSQKFLTAHFDLDEVWKELAVKACFTMRKHTTHIPLDDDECTVPWEVIKAGEFRVSLIGTAEEGVIRATSTEVRVRVEDGPVLTAENTREPTMNDVDRIHEVAAEANRKARNVVDRANSGEFNAKISEVRAESVPHGTPASVTNIGTGTDAKLVFMIPEGKQGAPGKQGPAGDSFYAFFTEEDVAKYIDEKKPETFKGLWLGETNEALEFGTVYDFTINGNEVDLERIGTLRGPAGEAGKDGESALVFSDISDITNYLKKINSGGFSFIWGGNDNVLFEYGNVSLKLAKGHIYRCKIVSKKLTTVTDNGNLRGADGVGISKIERTSGNGAAGATDTYTITLTDNTVGGTLHVYNGKDGIDAELYGIKGYTVKSNADILNLCEKYPNSYFLVVNTGDTFTAMSGTIDLEVNTGDICGVISSRLSGFSDIKYLDNSPISPEEAAIYHWTEIDENGEEVDRYTAVINGNSGGGAGGSSSGEYELINSFEVTANDVAKAVKGFAFSTDKDGKEFSLRAITAYCNFKAATGKGTFEVSIKNAGGASKGIYKRTDILDTAERWFKIDMELKGYWTGDSVNNTFVNGTTQSYGIFCRNKVSNKAYYINLVSDIVLPEGTTIEVYGVRA